MIPLARRERSRRPLKPPIFGERPLIEPLQARDSTEDTFERTTGSAQCGSGVKWFGHRAAHRIIEIVQPAQRGYDVIEMSKKAPSLELKGQILYYIGESIR